MPFSEREIQDHKQRLNASRKKEAERGEKYRKKHKVSALESATTKSQRRQLLNDQMTKALQGDPAAARLMVDRISPPLRAVAPPVHFPLDLSDAPSAAKSILQAVSEGRISVPDGKDLLAGLNSTAQIAELQRLAQELQELREQVAGQRERKSINLQEMDLLDDGVIDRKDVPGPGLYSEDSEW